MAELTLFDIENVDNDQFELSCHQNGIRYWLASELANMLGYTEYKTFLKSINKTMTVCTSLNMQIISHFIPLANNDFKLTRFACFLITMNADIKKEKVAKAQIYFASLADAISELMQAEQIERIEIREELTNKNKSLAAAANMAGVENYALFNNAGYMGMYNMSFNDLKKVKGIEGTTKSPLDFMGKRELAANLFRISETEAKIKSDHVYGQKNLENTAKEVGKKVRNIMIDNDGVRPEMLARQVALSDVKKNIKKVEKDYNKIDKNKK